MIVRINACFTRTYGPNMQPIVLQRSVLLNARKLVNDWVLACKYCTVLRDRSTNSYTDTTQHKTFHRRKSDESIHKHAEKRSEGLSVLRSTEQSSRIPYCTERKVGFTRKMQRELVRSKVVQPKDAKTAKVAIIGAPNVGKSTLLNKLLKWKVSAVSGKVHTTRHRTLGVLTDSNRQLIFLDTPGMITPERRKKHYLEMSLLTDPHSVLFEADIIVVLVDLCNVWERHQLPDEILKVLHLHRNKTCVLVINKCDVVRSKKEILHATRILTDGVVASRKDWYRPVRETKKKPNFYEQLFDRVDTLRNAEKPTTSSVHTTVPNENFNLAQDTDLNSSYIQNIDSDISKSSDSTHVVADNLHISNVGSFQHEASHTSEDTVPTNESVELKGTDEYKASMTTYPFHVLTFDGKQCANDAARPWHGYYYSDLHAIKKQIGERKGFDGFHRVFSVSALSGMGVDDLKEFLLSCATPGDWTYHESVVTDSDPIEMAEMCVKEALLNHMHKRAPYQTAVKVTHWEAEPDVLKVSFDIQVPSKSDKAFLLRGNPVMIRKISEHAYQQLADVFHMEVLVRLNVTVIQTSRALWSKKRKKRKRVGVKKE